MVSVARADGSSGLLGPRDRAAGVNGGLCFESPAGQGTLVRRYAPDPGTAFRSDGRSTTLISAPVGSGKPAR
jgi:hypothetical protein